MDPNRIPPQPPKPGATKMTFHRSEGPLDNKPAAPDSKPVPPPLQPRSLSSLSSQARTSPTQAPSIQTRSLLPGQPPAQQKPPTAQAMAPAVQQAGKPQTGKGLITASRPRPAADGDFEAFRKQKLREKQVNGLDLGHAESHRHKRIEGMSGTGEQYQDQKLAKATAEEIRHDNDEKIKSYHDQCITDRQKVSYDTDGQGKKLQDHRLGEGVQGSLDFSAGQGAKYQDHRLGKGVARAETDDVEFDDNNG